jgi:hypothetical protein
VTDDVVPPSYDAVSRSGHLGQLHPDAAARDAIPKARPRSSAHRAAPFVGRALGRDMAGGLCIHRGVALVAQTQFASERRSEKKLLLNMREDQMPAILNEALEWLDRAE